MKSGLGLAGQAQRNIEGVLLGKGQNTAERILGNASVVYNSTETDVHTLHLLSTLLQNPSLANDR